MKTLKRSKLAVNTVGRDNQFSLSALFIILLAVGIVLWYVYEIQGFLFKGPKSARSPQKAPAGAAVKELGKLPNLADVRRPASSASTPAPGAALSASPTPAPTPTQTVGPAAATPAGVARRVPQVGAQDIGPMEARVYFGSKLGRLIGWAWLILPVPLLASNIWLLLSGGLLKNLPIVPSRLTNWIRGHSLSSFALAVNWAALWPKRAKLDKRSGPPHSTASVG